MRVLFLSTWYPNDENPIYGTFVHEQAEALRALGVDIRIVQPIPRVPLPLTLLSQSYRRRAHLPKEEKRADFTVYHPRYLALPHHIWFQHVGDWMYRGIRQCIDAIYTEWPFELVHAHTTYPCGHAANLLRDRRFPELKVIHTIHGTCVRDAPGYNRACFERVRSSLEGADRNIFVSLEARRTAFEYTGGRIAGKSEYITNGVSGEKFELNEAERAEVASLRTLHSNTWNLVFVGYVSAGKGIKELLAAVRELNACGRKQVQLFLVGRNHLGSYVDRFLHANGMSERVIQVGPVPHERVKIWMNFADAVILPSHFEGLPTVLFECLYAGTAAIFTRVGGVGDVVVDGREAILIPPRSVEAIVQAIVRLMDNPLLCHEMGARGHKLVSENYTWAINAERCLKVYNEVLYGG